MNPKLKYIINLIGLIIITIFTILFIIVMVAFPIIILYLSAVLNLLLGQSPISKLLGWLLIILFPILAIVTYQIIKSILSDQTEVESYS